MSIVEYIILSMALSIETLMVVCHCARVNPIRLSRALWVAGLVAAVHAALAYVGLAFGAAIRFDFPEVDDLIYLGVMLLVAVKLLMGALRKNREFPAYDISRLGTVLLLAVATGINVFLVGVALGFRVSVHPDGLKLALSLLGVVWLFAYWAVMLGRQKVELRVRRWSLIAVLFLLVFALKAVIWG